MLRKWWVFVLFAALFLGAAYWHINRQTTLYTAKMSFMTTDDGGSGGFSRILQLAGQFGMGGSQAALKTDKIVELLSSKYMVYDALLKEVELDGKKDLLANHFLRIFQAQQNGGEAVDTNVFRFRSTKPAEFGFEENKSIQGIYSAIARGFLSVTAGKKSGIIKVNCTSPSEKFSKTFTEQLVYSLRDYYEEKAVEQQRETYRLISERTDSINNALRDAEYALAAWLDDNRTALKARTVMAQKLVARERYKRKAEILSVMYEEAVKNRELAHMNLLSSTPVIQIIDYPAYPLAELRPNALFIYAAALVASFGLAAFLIIFNKLVRDALREE